MLPIIAQHFNEARAHKVAVWTLNSRFLRGLIIGLSIAAPVGPIGVLCIRRTLADGRLQGLVSGLGAAAADATYGAVAGFGLTAVSSLLVNQQTWLRLVGGLFLVYLGLCTLLARPASKAPATGGRGLAGAVLSILALTLTNPLTILSFATVFAGLGLASQVGDYGGAAVLVLGVFLGSAAWWLILSTVVNLLRSRFSLNAMRWVNWLSGGRNRHFWPGGRGFAGAVAAIKLKAPARQCGDRSLSVGARGFEPPTPCTPCRCASRAAPRPD